MRQQPVPFHDDQRLQAQDLAQLFEAEYQGRRWHTVALHPTWGLVRGLNAAPDEHRQSVRIAPGMAYDIRGRVLVLPASTEVPLVTSAHGVLDLVAGYAEPSSPSIQKASPCNALGTPSSALPIQMHWMSPETVRIGQDVPLTRATVARGIIVALDDSVRRIARPLQRPRVATGRTLPVTAWTPWPSADRPLGWSIQIDTTAAGFSHTPHYFATLAGTSLDDHPDLGRMLLGPFTSIRGAHAQGFQFLALFAGRTPKSSEAAIEKLAALFQVPTPVVVWTGVEAADAPGSLRRLTRRSDT